MYIKRSGLDYKLTSRSRFKGRAKMTVKRLKSQSRHTRARIVRHADGTYLVYTRSN